MARPRFPDGHLPSFHWVPAVQVPQLRQYYEDVRLPASLSPRFVALRVTIPSAAPVVRSLRSRTPNRGPGVHNPVPLPEIAPGDVQGLPSSWGALMCLCHVLRPRRDRTHQALAVCRRGPRGVHTEGSPRVVLSRLNSTALALAVYASQWSLLAPTQDSLPAAGQALPGGIGYPQGSYERFQTVVILLSQASWRKDSVYNCYPQSILWKKPPEEKPEPGRGVQ